MATFDAAQLPPAGQWETTLFPVGDKLVAKENLAKARQMHFAPEPPPARPMEPERGSYVTMVLQAGSPLGLTLKGNVEATPKTVVVSSVKPKSAASLAGVRVGDRLSAVRGKELNTATLTTVAFSALVMSLPKLPRPLKLSFFRPLPKFDLSTFEAQRRATAVAAKAAAPGVRDDARRLVESQAKASDLLRDAKFSPRPPSQSPRSPPQARAAEPAKETSPPPPAETVPGASMLPPISARKPRSPRPSEPPVPVFESPRAGKGKGQAPPASGESTPEGGRSAPRADGGVAESKEDGGVEESKEDGVFESAKADDDYFDFIDRVEAATRAAVGRDAGRDADAASRSDAESEPLDPEMHPCGLPPPAPLEGEVLSDDELDRRDLDWPDDVPANLVRNLSF